MTKFVLFITAIVFVGYLVAYTGKITIVRDEGQYMSLPRSSLVDTSIISGNVDVTHTTAALIYHADIPNGIVGISDSTHADEPFDNIFRISLPDQPNSRQRVWLRYELFGVSSHTGIARSINDAQAVGGKFVQLNNSWTQQQELIPYTLLHKGNNIIRFGLPLRASYQYRIRNVNITICSSSKTDVLVINQPDNFYFGQEAYIKGSINLGKKIAEKTKLFCNNQPVEIIDNEFETTVNGDKNRGGPLNAKLKAILPSGKIITRQIRFTKHSGDFQKYIPDPKGILKEGEYIRDKDFQLSLPYGKSSTSINIPASALTANKAISITALRDVDMVALNTDLVNVTHEAKAYRFLPHGSNFSIETNLSIPYDSTLIPDGYTAADIRTYYFDEQYRRWIPLPLDSILTDECLVRSKTTHFTDMINGIIKIPESPQTQGYTPTSIKDLKAADPSSGINLINSPVANNTGGASLSFNLKVPAGTQSLQPDLMLQYNNQGGNGWIGLGWSLSTPGIGIDIRWGAARYDATYETESYTLNGQSLAPIAQRGNLRPRESNKKFTARIEGPFNQIIRHGDHPSNYWWEVTAKDGTTHFYGGTLAQGVISEAVQKDNNGNIAYWALVETRNANDNYVLYEYETVIDRGMPNGMVDGRQLYISRIHYTGHGNTRGPYKVEFIRDGQLGEAKRKDIEINGTLGFKMVTAHLLRKVYVTVQDEPIRSYDLQYKEGAFGKTLLKSISELDAADNLFYTHQFDYYDDVNLQGNFRPLNYVEPWDPSSDDIKGDLLNPIRDFTAEGSALSTSKSSNFNGGLTLTVGTTFAGIWSKLVSVGGNFSYGEDKSEGIVSMLDLNGDGLPDKVFKKNGNLYYRSGSGNSAAPFRSARLVLGRNDFSLSSSKSTTTGFQIVPLIAFYGNSNTHTTTATTDYFSDFNGDGLIDIASNGRVYFNRINSSGEPEFVDSSDKTPSSIIPGGFVDKKFLIQDLQLQEKQENQFPLHDIVRVWQAPFDGAVKITAPVRLLNVSSPTGIVNTKKDGVRVSIQVGQKESWLLKIEANDHTIKIPANVDSIPVKKGQRIYFRVESVYNGEDDLVEWSPIIEYRNPVVPAIDVNKRSNSKYVLTEDYILDSKSATRMGKDGIIRIDGNFTKGITSDTVILEILRNRGNVDSVIHRDTFPPSGQANQVIVIKDLAVKVSDNLIFRLLADTYIDRFRLNWVPHFEYTAFDDATPVTNNLGQPNIESYITPNNGNYNDWRIVSELMNVAKQDTIKIVPYIALKKNPKGKITFTIKTLDTIINKQSRSIVAGQTLPVFDTVRLVRIAGTSYYIDYTIDSANLANTVTAAEVRTFKDTVIMDMDNKPVNVILSDTLVAGLYTNYSERPFGPLFRGWGAFCFKGAKDHALLDENKLNQNEYTTYPTDTSVYKTPAIFNTLLDPSKTNFIGLFPNVNLSTWYGHDSAVYVSNTLMSSSRLWMHDVSVDSFMRGGTVNAVNKISTTKTNSRSLGINFGISASEGETNATTTINLDMMDMNGDRYPDVVNETGIQFTWPTGGLQPSMKPHYTDPVISEGYSSGVSLGGGFPVAHTTRNTPGAAMDEQKEASTSFALSGNTANGTNNTVVTWNDINGDGLPDKVHKDGRVALNLGYSFTVPEKWNIDSIEKDISRSDGAGLGVTFDAGSWQAGVGLSRGNSFTSSTLQDINGDGLPDQLVPGNHILARINTGSGFANPVVWGDRDTISSNVSTGESINAAYTFVFTFFIIPIKVCINPSVSIGHGVSRREYQVMDIDGDGYPDILQSEKDGNLSASRSLIGRTNMLQKVTRPLGGSLTLDYHRMGNNYDMPQSKWVLKSVEVTDGLKGDGVDTMRSVFNYEGGLYDRHEREFYGFSKITTEQLNTEANNIVYRRQVKTFLNKSYYQKGLLHREWMEDAAGHKFTETINEYTFRQVGGTTSYSEYPALVRVEKLFYEGQSVPGSSTVTTFDYDAIGNIKTINDEGDGTIGDRITAEVTYHNLPADYIMSVPSGITVTTIEGVKRKRSTSIDNSGNIIRIQQFLEDGKAAITDMQYDSYGNLSKIIKPANYKNERMWYAYEYDNVTHNYVTKVTDAFGYKSTSTYDYRFGTVSGTVSMNEEPMSYTFDACGRLATVTGPYEIAAGKPYTIAQEYFPGAVVPYAITRHFDPEHNDDIRTITFMDGHARPVQVKKQSAMFKGKNIDDELRMIISGKIIYDAFGRALETYYPLTEPIGTNTTYSSLIGAIATTSTFDVQDRQLTTVLADGTSTSMEYILSNSLFKTRTTDALNNAKETMTDVKGRNRITRILNGPDGIITTTFFYNALSELIEVKDTKQNSTIYTYDNLGRKLSMQHPDAGLTTHTYDLAGNMLQKVTAQLRKEIPNDGAIKYGYEYERLTDIDYPRYYQNKVKYVYGAPGSASRTGRLMLVMDASGGEEYYYGKLGEITKTIRTVLISPVYAVTYVSEQEYDTWNRIKKMTYADGEKVTYHYNKGGSLHSFEGEKQGNTYRYLDQAGYDEYDKRVYMRYGNGIETEYKYDPLRRRLINLRALTASGTELMDNNYKYDAVSNILSIENDRVVDSAKLGGYARYDYDYDNLYRLVKAKGVYRGRMKAYGYDLEMQYDNLYNIVNKKMIDSLPQNSYDHAYHYDGTPPHQATKIGTTNYSYDANGNLLGSIASENFWDEENRLIAVLSNGTISRYTYNASGERVVKSSGGIQGIWVNGAPAGTIKHYDNYTAYVSPYLVCRKDAFTKHYYIESQRITSKIGYGRFINTSFPTAALTAGGVDYTKRAADIEKSMTNYYASLGISPGPPTDKNFWGRPENSGIAPPVYVDGSASAVPPGWPSGPVTAPWYGQPIVLAGVPSRDSVRAGFGFEGTGHEYEKFQYFYHSDHLGSTSYVTDILGEANQHVEYSAFGETYFEEHTNSNTSPYLFNAKEKDVETGLYYYGARYYDAKTSVWLSVDVMTEKYPDLSPYNYGLNNPVRMTDPDGNDVDDAIEIPEQLLKNTCDLDDKDLTGSNNHVEQAKSENTDWEITTEMSKKKMEKMMDQKPSAWMRQKANQLYKTPNLNLSSSVKNVGKKLGFELDHKGSGFNNLKNDLKNVGRAMDIYEAVTDTKEFVEGFVKDFAAEKALKFIGVVGMRANVIMGIFTSSELGDSEIKPGEHPKLYDFNQKNISPQNRFP